MNASSSATQIDPAQEHLGGLYAKALLGATEKAGNSEAALADLGEILDLLGKVSQLAAALDSPRVPFPAKESLLDRAFHGRISRELLNFLKVVARRGRFAALPAMYRAARKQLNELRGRVHVRVQTAEPMDSTLRNLVLNQLTAALGREVDLETQVKPDLLGGMVVRVGDTVFDGSVAERLSQMRQATRQQAATRIRDSLSRFAVDA